MNDTQFRGSRQGPGIPAEMDLQVGDFPWAGFNTKEDDGRRGA